MQTIAIWLFCSFPIYSWAQNPNRADTATQKDLIDIAKATLKN